MVASSYCVQASTFSVAFDPTGNTLSQQSSALAAPTITAQPVSLPAASPGLIAGFSVTIASPSPATYQWYFNGNLIPGATRDNLLLPTVNTAAEGSYTVRVTNGTGSVTSQAATLARTGACIAYRILNHRLPEESRS